MRCASASPSTFAWRARIVSPTLVESLTYRFRGHSAADPEVYRTKEEVQQWRKRDPIVIFAERLKEAGMSTTRL